VRSNPDDRPANEFGRAVASFYHCGLVLMGYIGPIMIDLSFFKLKILALAVILPLFAMPAYAGAINEVTVVTAKARHHFTIELAATPSSRRTGLMHRQTMAVDAGMLFIFPGPERLSFWMRNTLIPLDMLFLAGNGRIVHMHHRAVPHSLTPIVTPVDATAVLEINGGLSRRLGIQVGDRVLHPSLR
jgi:hypothetical protein